MPNQAKSAQLKRLDQQIARLQRRIDVLHARSERLSRWRISVFSIGMLASLVAIYALAFEMGIALAVISIVVFAVVVNIHQRVDGLLKRYRIWQQIKQAHVARMTIDWTVLPEPPAHDYPDEHPFAIDLNLVGGRSMLHLLDTSTTYEGSERLQNWLLNTAPDPDETRERRLFVEQSRQSFMFRDKLMLFEKLAGRQGRIRGQRIMDWFRQPSLLDEIRPTLRLAALLALVNIVLIAAFLSVEMPPLFLVSGFVYLFIVFRKAETIGERFDSVRSIYASFLRIRSILSHLENTHHPIFADVLAVYHQQPPSTALRRLTQLMVASSARQNPLLWLILNMVVPYDLFFAHQLEKQKPTLEVRMQSWLESLYQLEALNALANFAYLNPDYGFAELQQGHGLHAQSIGHPLLRDEQRIANDFNLAEQHDVVIITGSNMSGKSTFLRTLGVNLVLAYAGAPVCAAGLQASFFRIFSSIKVSDSINDGISYFYAEVRRLRALLDELHRDDQRPVFFLIDEIFKGTNNRERLIGSRAYIRALAQAHGVGLVATHDLELVRLADEFPAIRNYHFREDIRNGRMVFDYRIHTGPSPTTNALRIMEIEGLPVE